MLSNLIGAAAVFHPARLPSVERSATARTTPLVTAARGATGFINGITDFAPGSTIGEHTHNVAESVMVVAGRAIVAIDGAEHLLERLDTTFVPANIPHQFTNASLTEPMSLFWTYGSIDPTRTMTAEGEPRLIHDEHRGAVNPYPLIRQTIDYHVTPGHEAAFEDAIRRGVPVLQQTLGARTLRLESSRQTPCRYRLIISWETLDGHVARFLESPEHRSWREAVDTHLDRSPQIDYVRTVLDGF